MTQEQIIKAKQWKLKHNDHVESMIIEGERTFYEPTGSDAGSPELWKPAHWRWLLTQRTK